ncbi:MAG: purine-cytosine permease family protein [Pseudomonadales bacterium]
MSAESTEFATEPVPDSNTVGWFRVALVAAMVAFSLPTFLTGLEVSLVTSAQRTAQALLAGAVILTVIGCLTASIGARTRLSSYMLNRIAFGSQGAALVNLAFALSLLGWFGVNIDLFSGAAQRLAADLFGYTLAAWPIELFAGVVMTVTTVFGFRAINILSMLLVPILVAVTGLLIAGSLEVRPIAEIMSAHKDNELAFGDAVSSVVGAVIIGAVILPDITRFIRHWHGAIYVVVIAYLFIDFIVTSAGGLAAAALGDGDLLNIMITIGLGWAAFAIIICGSWVLNSLNLYSTMLSVESTAPSLNNRLVVAVLGSLGTLAAFLNILDHFLTFLFYLAIVFVPVAGVIAVDYLFLRRSAYHDDRLDLQSKIRPKAIIAWAGGACIALLGSAGWVQISSIAAIDAMLVAALAYYLLARFGTDRSTHMAAKVNE